MTKLTNVILKGTDCGLDISTIWSTPVLQLKGAVCKISSLDSVDCSFLFP